MLCVWVGADGAPADNLVFGEFRGGLGVGSFLLGGLTFGLQLRFLRLGLLDPEPSRRIAESRLPIDT
jgi:hypothetical protein